MPKQNCAVCGREEWQEKLLFCSVDEIWLCSRCCYFAGLNDPAPRCPRCRHQLQAGFDSAFR